MKKATYLFLITAAMASAQTHAQTHKKPAAKPIEFPNKSTAFDKKTMEAYIRHLFVWPPPIEITVGDPKPSQLPGFSEVTVTASQGNISQDEKFFVSKDGQQIVRGTVFRISDNPFKENLEKLKTELRPSLGTAGAPVVLVDFSDFQCPHCKEAAKTLRQNLVKAYPKEVHLYFMDFPIDAIHPWAKAAAMAGRCVARQSGDAFWTYHDWIFDHQDEMTPGNLRDHVLSWGKSKDLDVIGLTTCIDSRATEGEVEASVAMGKALDVTSTPTVFVNGRPLTGAVPWPDLQRIIDFEIGYQQTARNAGENCGCDVKLPTPGVK